MINVLIPITDRIDKYRELLEALKNDTDCTVYLATQEKLYPMLEAEYSEIENFELFQFDQGSSKEEMINGVQNYIKAGSLMILRKPVTVKEFNKIISSDKDVVTSKVPKSRVKTFFFRMWQKLTKLVLGVKMYSGEPSVLYFNQDLADVALRTNNLSYSTRVNRWKGATQAVISTEHRGDKSQIQKGQTIRNSIVAGIFVAIAVVVSVIVGIFVPTTVASVLLLLCLDLVCVALACIFIIMAIFTNMTGPRAVKYALLISRNRRDR